jgi:hypothetical protein
VRVPCQVLVRSPLAILVNWSAPLDTGLGPSVVPPRSLTSYRLEQLSLAAAAPGPDPDFAPASATVLGGLTRSLSVGPLVKGRFYYFRVRAHNSAGPGNWTAVQSERGVDLPLPVQGLSAACFRPLAINVSWVAPADTGLGPGQPSRLFAAGGYLLEVSLNASFAAATADLLAGNETTRILTGLAKGQPYYFRVRARNSAGQT